MSVQSTSQATGLSQREETLTPIYGFCDRVLMINSVEKMNGLSNGKKGSQTQGGLIVVKKPKKA